MNPSEANETAPDGGTAGELDLFSRTAETRERTTLEKLYRNYDVLIGAPLRVAWSDLRMRIGSLIVFGFIFMGTVGTNFVEAPYVLQGVQFEPALQSMAHPLGTDNMGRDMVSQITHSTPAMLKMVFAGGVLSVVLGTSIGAVAGYVGGWVDRVLMVITDTVLTIPGLPLVIVIAAVWSPRNPFLVGIILGIDNWPGLSRTLRSQVLSIREEEMTEAARAMGLSKFTIIRRYIVTNTAPYILVNLATGSRGIIFESVALYYLGILPYTTLNWGVMLDKAYESGFTTDPEKIHMLLVPMLTIVIVSFGFILMAQGMDRVFNVRLRAKHAKTTSDEGTGELG